MKCLTGDGYPASWDEVTGDPPAEPLALSRFAGQRFPQGERFAFCISELFAEPLTAERKEQLPQWSSAMFKGDYRKRDNAETVTCFVSDVDEWTGSAHDFASAFARVLPGVWADWHTTMSAEPGALRWRIVLGVSRPVMASEFLPLWRALAAVTARQGIQLDPTTKDVSKAYLWPAKRPGGVWYADSRTGRGLDVDAATHAGRRILDAEYEPPASVRTVKHADRYTAAAIEREAHAVRTAGRGTRNATLNGAAFALARLDIAADTIAQVLTDAATQAGLSKEETRATIRGALKARRKQAA